MHSITDFIDRIAEQYAAKHKAELLKKKPIKDYLAEHDEHYARWAAFAAMENTPLEIGTDPNRNYYSPDYDAIPPEWLASLKHGNFPIFSIKGTTRKQREDVQQIFTHGDNPNKIKDNRKFRPGYLQQVEWGFRQSSRDYLKSRRTTIAVILAIVIAAVGFGGHSYLRHKADVKYWATINTAQTYSGDGFTENFPCGQVKTTNDLSSPDLTSNTSQCEYFGGSNHEAIDIYKVQVEHFFTTKYDPASEVACGDPMHYTGRADNQVYYNESRQVDGFTWVVCGVGQDPIVARLQNGNTVYTLEALPNTEKNTAADLDTLIRGFQLN